MSHYNLRLPIEPKAASRPRLGNGRAYKAAGYRKWSDRATALIRERWEHDPLTTPLKVTINFLMAKPKTTKLPFPKPDIDNFIKAVLDAANGIVWEDDWLVQKVTAEKQWAKTDAVVISIREA